MTASAEPAAAPVQGRSLWASAWFRLRRNRAAMVSLWVLAFFVLAGAFGPMVAPHDYARVYPAFVKVPASLEPYPREDTIVPAAERTLARARLEPQEVTLEGGTLRMVAASPREGAPEGGWFPEERVSVETALRAYTVNNAWAEGREDRKGSIETGKLADLVVLDRSPLAVPADSIADLDVLYTIVDGRVAYEGP